MTQLAKNTPRYFVETQERRFNDFPASNVVIYEGSAVGLASGYARQCTTSDTFVGFARRKCDNSDGSAGDKYVNVEQVGAVQLTVVGASAVTDVGSTVYLTDGNTFTLTASGGLAIGKVERWVSGTTCIVRFEGAPHRSI